MCELFRLAQPDDLHRKRNVTQITVEAVILFVTKLKSCSLGLKWTSIVIKGKKA